MSGKAWVLRDEHGEEGTLHIACGLEIPALGHSVLLNTPRQALSSGAPPMPCWQGGRFAFCLITPTLKSGQCLRIPRAGVRSEPPTVLGVM